ncbi:MAG: protein-L-isoaspartate O-methyltransferase [Proteobacteria bacterium]|nr:protein-L-isoaspartate O-methyltransferase [Pseudomonadota bacterium]
METVTASEQMIEQQVRAWDVLDGRVLDAMRTVPRELFVPESQRYRAFADAEVPLAHGQHMLRPSVAGRVLQALLPEPTEQVLEIGTGSGFLSACLARLAARVHTVELYPDLAEAARGNLATAGVRSVDVLEADALRMNGGADYDAIAVTASLPIYVPHFERMLAVGGRLFVVVGEAPAMEARLVTRTGSDTWQVQSLFETVIDPLVNSIRPPEFSF